MRWTAENHFRFERNGKVRSFDVAARRYDDGAFVGCVRAPSACGSFMHTVELPASTVRETRELMRDTASTLARAMLARPKAETVGAFADIVGHSQELLAVPLPRATPGIVGGMFDIVGFDLAGIRGLDFDIVGDFGDVLRAAQARAAAGASGAATGALTGALQGAASGAPITSAEGAIGQAIQGAAASLGLPRASDAADALQRLFRGGGAPDPATVASVADAVQRVQAAVQAAQQPRLTQVGFRSAAQGAGEGLALPASEVIRATQEPLPGAVAANVSRSVDQRTAGAAQGSAELLARALAALALERGSTRGEVEEAARIASTMLRSVDAIAGARAGDPRARAAIRSAVNSASDRTARALRAALSLVGG